MSATIPQEKRLNTIAWIVTGAVLILVGLMRRVKIPLPEGMDFSFLPHIHARLNAITAVVLVVALIFIKQKNVAAHRTAIFVALGCSALFLLSYVAYHFTTPETIFGDTNYDGELSAAELAEVGSARTIYLTLLFSHIVLAA